MNGKYFLDTNIFIYSFDTSSPLKQKKAQALIKNAISKGIGVISYQVIQEFLNVALKKFLEPMPLSDCRIYLTQVLAPLCAIYPSVDFYKFALEIKEVAGYSMYDSLILTAALQSKCNTLYSEDFQDGFRISGLTIRNPF